MYPEWQRVNEECHQLIHIGDILYDDSSLENSQKDILKTVISYFGAESGQFCLHKSEKPVACKEKTALQNLSWAYTQQYIDYYHDLDPFVHIMPEVRAFRDNDLLSAILWRSCEFNDDFIRPQKIRHLLVMRVHNDTHMLGHMGVFRSCDGPAFSKKDLFKAQYLSSVLSQNLRLKNLLQRSQEMEGVIRQFMGVPSTEVLILDSNLNLVYWNPQTLQSCLSTSPDQKNTGSIKKNYPILPGNIMEKCIKIRESLRENYSSLYSENRYALSWSETGRQVTSEIIVLPSSNHPDITFSSFHFLIVLHYVHRSTLAHRSSGTGDHKLTYKEVEIAKFICQGLTNKEIGQQLYVSLPTVVTHVKHIYQKLGVQRRSQLIHNLLS